MRCEWELQNPPPRSEAAWTEYGQTVFRQVERWMDAGHGACWFGRPEYAAELRRAILHFHEVRYEVGAFVIMANHCHLAIRRLEDYQLEAEIGAMKSVTANFVNRGEGRRGELWQCCGRSPDRATGRTAGLHGIAARRPSVG